MFNIIVETPSVDLTVYSRSLTYSSSTFVFVMSKGVDKFAQQQDITLVLVRVEISVSGGCLSSCGRRAGAGERHRKFSERWSSGGDQGGGKLVDRSCGVTCGPLTPPHPPPSPCRAADNH